MYVERLKNDLIRQFFRAAKLKFLENIVTIIIDKIGVDK